MAADDQTGDADNHGSRGPRPAARGPRADPGPTVLILVRHGQTESNIRGLLHGQADVPLTAHGVEQAWLVAARLAGERDIAALYASPLERARHTAAIIGEATGLAPILHPGLMEINFGQAEGLTVAEAIERHPHLRIGDDDDGTDELQWPEGESRGEFRRRVRETLGEIVGRHAGETIVVATHGGVISVGVAELLGEPTGDWRRYLVANCAVTQLVWERPGAAPIVARLDDRAHLADLQAAGPPGVFERGVGGEGE